jgi:dimethylhistidine N-methyltransferase
MNDANASSVRFIDFAPADNFSTDVLSGLSAAQKSIPPKYFYDERGSQLFEAICELPEYYLTRAEISLLQVHAPEIAQLIAKDCALIEYGSGVSRKTRILIEAARPAVYMPIDIARESLEQSSARLAGDYPWLEIHAIWGDYSLPLALPEVPARKVVFFPGSTIGNFTPDDALAFLRNCWKIAAPGGAMIVGVDLKKPEALLNAAYDDAQGVTAAFNLNLLTRINRELNGNFNVDQFRHRAFYNPAASRVEMHLESEIPQSAMVGDHTFRFAKRETIHTENSYKYAVSEFQQLARASGFDPVRSWSDALFSIHYLSAS